MLGRPRHSGGRWLAAAAVLLVIATLSGRASAQEPAAAGESVVLERSLYKTMVFEAGTNLLDLALFASILGGHLYAGPAFLAVNATASAAMYYGHEVAWGYLGPPEEEYDPKTNILKGLTFRLASSTRAFAIGYGFTGDPVAATGFTIFSAVGETVMYVTNEYSWAFYDRMRDPSFAEGPASASPASMAQAAMVPATMIQHDRRVPSQ